MHRAFDTGGALLGPLLAVVLLGVAPGSYSTLFTAAFLLAVVGLAILALFVENRRPAEDAPPPAVVPPAVAVVPVVPVVLGVLGVWRRLAERRDGCGLLSPGYGRTGRYAGCSRRRRC